MPLLACLWKHFQRNKYIFASFSTSYHQVLFQKNILLSFYVKNMMVTCGDALENRQSCSYFNANVEKNIEKSTSLKLKICIKLQ